MLAGGPGYSRPQPARHVYRDYVAPQRVWKLFLSPFLVVDILVQKTSSGGDEMLADAGELVPME